MMTITEYAKQHSISYQAVNQQIQRFNKDLIGHILKQGKTRYLDDYAVEFLDGKRKVNTLVITDQSTVAKVTQLEKENKELLIQVTELQRHIIGQDQTVARLQGDQIKALEDAKKKDDLLRAERERSDRRVQEVEQRAAEAETELAAAKQQIVEASQKIAETEQRLQETLAELEAAKAVPAERPGFFASLFRAFRNK